MLEKQATSSADQSCRANPKAMKPQALLLLCAAVFFSASSSPVTPADHIQIQEGFDEARVYGTWYAIAFGTTCEWVKKYKDQYLMGTLVVAPGKTSMELSVTSTRLRQGACSQAAGVYQKTSTPGKYHYHDSRWETQVEGYVTRTNYDEYAFLTWKKNSNNGHTITTQLYGECVPAQPELSLQRDRRSAWDEEAGSADGSLSFMGGNRGDFCLQPQDAGPCLGMEARFSYNTTSQNCEKFYFGGCRGNQNNFHSERDCLQTCRTEAACRLPIVSGESCKAKFWAFDANQGKCVTFQGCGGNANKFYLEKECQEYCGVFPGDGEEFLRLSTQ